MIYWKSHRCQWECKVVQPFWEIVLQNVNAKKKKKNVNAVLLYEPASLLLEIYPQEYETYVHTKTCPQMFITALFTLAKR